MASCDYLIIGGGIAGLTLASYLENANQDFLIVNSDLDGAATRVSSGLINPVTGQRFVLSWNYELIKTEFLKFYKSIEDKFSCDLIRETQLIQVLKTAEEQNLWSSRTADRLYNNYFGESDHDFSNRFETGSGAFGIINSAYLIKIEEFILHMQNHFMQTSRLINEQFNFNEFTRTEKEMTWKDIAIRKAIVFAEGFRVLSNPFFNWLPIVALKGECLHIEIPGFNFNSVFKSEYSIVPMKDDLYWCGSNFYLFETRLETSETEKNHQLDFLNRTLKFPYQMIDHLYGIRPASRDRRPVIGSHPEDKRLVVFNGLGTKGLSIAPYCAMHLVQYLVNGIPVPKEMHSERFLSKGFSPSAL